ncbi:hypothetical protein CFP66_03030 [Pseudonocardia sp. MH-G8]|nr:hypothetical protein CFP66_03030 [Pseudonocardia sp. MH-G8]
MVGAALLAAPGVGAAQEPDVVSADADVDGDGAANPVTLQQVAPGTQLLRVGLADEFVDAQVSGDETLPLIVPFVVDVNGDGRDELILARSLGANTTTFEVWSLDDGRLHAVTTEDGAPWWLYEGGGVSAIGAYGCVPGTPGRQLRDVQARLDDAASGDGTTRYDGAVVTYAVAGGVAHPAATEPLQDVTRDDPRVQVDPATCAPLD